MRGILGEVAFLRPDLYVHTLTRRELDRVLEVTKGELLVGNGVTYLIKVEEIYLLTGIFRVRLEKK